MEIYTNSKNHWTIPAVPAMAIKGKLFSFESNTLTALPLRSNKDAKCNTMKSIYWIPNILQCYTPHIKSYWYSYFIICMYILSEAHQRCIWKIGKIFFVSNAYPLSIWIGQNRITGVMVNNLFLMCQNGIACKWNGNETIYIHIQYITCPYLNILMFSNHKRIIITGRSTFTLVFM